jgi:hypothetical protein
MIEKRVISMHDLKREVIVQCPVCGGCEITQLDKVHPQEAFRIMFVCEFCFEEIRRRDEDSEAADPVYFDVNGRQIY